MHDIKSIDDILVSSYDSTSYIKVGNYLWGNGDPGYVGVRPFLYPFFVKFFCFIDFKLIWIVQAFMWLITGNLIYNTLSHITRPKLAIVGLFIFSLNFSLIMLTLHILSEITTVFILAIMVHYLVKRKDLFNLETLTITILLLGLLTVVRPAFYYLFCIALLFIFLFWRQWNLKRLILIFLMTIPVLFQLTLVKVNTGKFSISTVGFHTFKDYYYSRAYGIVHNIHWNDARKLAYHHTNNEILQNIKADKWSYVNTYLENIQLNIKSPPIFLSFPETQLSKNILYDFMMIENNLYYFIHIIFNGLFILLLFFKLPNKRLLLLLFGINLFIFFTSGVSFDQGDRLVIIALPVWIVFYLMLIPQFWLFWSRKSSLH